MVDQQTTFKIWLLTWMESNWTMILLLALFFFLLAAHGFEIHYNRPLAVVTWNENMISAVFTAIIAKLK